jgi:lactoylglutathione lyase
MVEVELHVGDVDAAVDFYTDVGFEVEGRGASWARLRLGGGRLRLQSDDYIKSHPHYFSEHLDRRPRGIGVEIVVEVDEGIDEVAARMHARGAIVKDLHERPWGARDFRVADPDGYFVRVTTPLSDRGPTTQ